MKMSEAAEILRDYTMGLLRSARASSRTPQRAPASSGAAVLSLALGVSAIASPVSAHSLTDVQNQLFKNEQYFQIVNREPPQFDLQDADGRPVSLSSFKGKVVVLHFIDGHCTDLCPLHSELLAKIQKTIDGTAMRNQVQFVSITINPSQDTPDILKKYGPLHGFDPASWVFLTTRPGQPEDMTRKLAEQLGQKFTKTADGDFIHGVVTYVVDQNGMLRGNFYGLEFKPANLIAFVNALANDVGGTARGDNDGASLGFVSDQSEPAAGGRGWLLAIPAALLGLAVIWIVGVIAFFRRRRRIVRQISAEQGREGRTTTPPASGSRSGAN